MRSRKIDLLRQVLPMLLGGLLFGVMASAPAGAAEGTASVAKSGAPASHMVTLRSAPTAQADLAASPWTGTLTVSNTVELDGFAPGSVQGTFTIRPRQAAPADGVYDALLTYRIDYTDVVGCLTFHYTGGGTNVPGAVTLNYGTLDPIGPPASINFRPSASTSVQTFVTITDCAGQVTGPAPNGGLVFTEDHVPPADATGQAIQGLLPDFDTTHLYNVTADLHRTAAAVPPPPDIDPASTHGLVASTSATFSFSDTEAGVSFRCSRDGGAFIACTSPKSYTALAQGGHTFSVRAVDGAGNIGEAATTTWTVDTVRPVVTIQSGPATSGNDASPVFTFSTSEPAETSCSLMLSTAADIFARCTSPQGFTDLPDGRYRFAVTATDPAGNTSLRVARTFKVDTKAPAVRLTGKPVAATNDNTPTFTFSTEAGASTRCSLQPSGAPADLAPCASPASYGPLADGTYTFAVTGTDGAGNTSAPVKYTFRVDTLAPTATPKSPADGATAVSLTGNVTAQLSEPVNGVTGTSFTLTTPGGQSVPATVTYSATSRVATLNPTANLDPDTKYTVTLSSAITDKAGNALGTTTWTFVTGPRPTAAISPVPNSTTVLVTANVTARFSEAVTGVSGDSFTLTGPGGATVVAAFSYNPVTRTATLDPIDPLAAATKYTATVTSAVKDRAGNPFATRTWSFTTRP